MKDRRYDVVNTVKDIFQNEPVKEKLTISPQKAILTLKERMELRADFELCNGYTFVWRLDHRCREKEGYIYSMRYIAYMPESERKRNLMRKLFRNFFHDQAIAKDQKRKLLNLFFYWATGRKSFGSPDEIVDYFRGYLEKDSFKKL